jgi:beta-mannosidase
LATVETGWLPATVPGHVHLDLVENGVIGHPFERMNELGCQWVDQADWSYRTTFFWKPTDGLPTRVLRFEGLDTICKITLNGVQIGEHENMFVPLEIDVSSALVEGENALQIDFQSAVRVGEERRKAYFEKDALREDTPRFEERSFVRKAQYMYGWDWGPRLVSCGIWRPVALLEFEARILDVHVTQTHLETGEVELRCEVATQGNAQFVTVHGFDPDGEFIDAFMDAQPGDTITLEDPYLWDPTDPQTYDVTVSLCAFSTSPEGEQTIVLKDMKSLQVGLVKKVLIREPDEFGESFEFQVNGLRLWARGANWIPDHSFPSTVTKAQYRDRLEKAKDMGFNMLRVWGGGLYETDEFYDLCDELGILVWQDFAFACAYYPDDEAWQKIIREEAVSNVKRLRNHPSLALWCGNNENHELHANWSRPPRRPGHYYGINHYDKVLPDVVAELDPSTSYIASSPIGEDPNNDGKAEKQTGPNSGGYGDQHCWDVWHGRGDWRYYADSTGRFSSEYGFVSSCSTALWSKTIEDSDWDPHSKVVRWHDRTGKEHGAYHGYVKLHYPDATTLEDWVYYSQLNQRDALRFGVEHYRRSAFCRGSLIWQLNDCWPVQSWAILDSDGDYKALGYELRRLYADNLLSIARDGDKVIVWAVNDGPDPWAAFVSLTASDLSTGDILGEWQGEFDIDADSRQPVLEASVHGLAVPDVLLTATDADGEATTWQLLAEPKAARLPTPEPLTISTSSEGILTILTTTPVVDLMLTEDGSPGPFLDNFITLPQAGLIAVRISRVPDAIEARSLAGEHKVKITRSPI